LVFGIILFGMLAVGFAVTGLRWGRQLLTEKLPNSFASFGPDLFRISDVCFVVSDGFRGAFVLLEDKHNGVRLKSDGGRLTITIPEDGVLRVRSLKEFPGMYRPVATFANGTPIRCLLLGERDTNQFGIFELGSASETRLGSKEPTEYLMFYTGTQSEFEARKHFRGLIRIR
jgi:hypothetical protein